MRESFHVDWELPVAFDASIDIFRAIDQGPGKRHDLFYYLKRLDLFLWIDMNHASGPRVIGFRRGGELSAEVPFWDRVEAFGPRMLAFLVVNPRNGFPHTCLLNIDVLIERARADGRMLADWTPLRPFITFGEIPIIPAAVTGLVIEHR